MPLNNAPKKVDLSNLEQQLGVTPSQVCDVLVRIAGLQPFDAKVLIDNYSTLDVDDPYIKDLYDIVNTAILNQ